MLTAARPGWTRLLVTWAATAGWVMLPYLVLVTALYGVPLRPARDVALVQLRAGRVTLAQVR